MEQVEQATVVPIRSIQEHVSIVMRKWEGLDRAGEGIERAREKEQTTRLDLALELKDLKDRIDAGEAGELTVWWEWYEDNFRRSRGDAEKLLKLANANDPKAAYEASKAREAERARMYRKFPLEKFPLEKPKQNQAPSYVGGTVVEANFTRPAKRITPTVPKYTTGPDDDELLAQITAAIPRLSWNGLVRLMKWITNWYERKRMGAG